jgi:hypothetical protein
MSIMNGNVGVGTWVPKAQLDVEGTLSIASFGGNVGIGTWVSPENLTVAGIMQLQEAAHPNYAYFVYPNSIVTGDTYDMEFNALTGNTSTGFVVINRNGAGNQINGLALNGNGNFGIGTLSPGGGLVVMSGNVGIGTWIPAGALDIKTGNNILIESGNVGIGSAAPGQILDVQGTLRILGGGSIGIGTSLTSNSAVTVMSGNIGLGTWSPSALFEVGTQKVDILSNGNVGLGTIAPTGALEVEGGNVGIGTWSPGVKLQVNGAFTSGVVTLTDAATINTNASLSNLFRVTLGGNRTLANPTNAIDGEKVTWELIQDGTGNRTITLGSQFDLGTDIASITLSTTANTRDFMGAIYNATTNEWYVVSFIKGY